MGIIVRVNETVKGWVLLFAARKFRTTRVPELDNRTALEWLAEFLEGFEQGAPGVLRQEIEKNTTLWDILPEGFKTHVLKNKSGESYGDSLTSAEVAEIVHSGLAEVSPPLAKICTREWFEYSFEEYKRHERAD